MLLVLKLVNCVCFGKHLIQLVGAHQTWCYSLGAFYALKHVMLNKRLSRLVFWVRVLVLGPACWAFYTISPSPSGTCLVEQIIYWGKKKSNLTIWTKCHIAVAAGWWGAYDLLITFYWGWLGDLLIIASIFLSFRWVWSKFLELHTTVVGWEHNLTARSKMKRKVGKKGKTIMINFTVRRLCYAYASHYSLKINPLTTSVFCFLLCPAFHK